MSPPSHSSRFDYPNNIWWWVHAPPKKKQKKINCRTRVAVRWLRYKLSNETTRH
jgi:hypothetical protein